MSQIKDINNFTTAYGMSCELVTKEQPFYDGGAEPFLSSREQKTVLFKNNKNEIVSEIYWTTDCYEPHISVLAYKTNSSTPLTITDEKGNDKTIETISEALDASYKMLDIDSLTLRIHNLTSQESVNENQTLFTLFQSSHEKIKYKPLHASYVME